MFDRPSLFNRIAIGKLTGFLFGLMGYAILAISLPEAPEMLRWGVLFWYTTLGAIIGVFGMFTWHPVLKMPLPWWVRGPLIGAWMNFVLVLVSYDTFAHLIRVMFGEDGMFISPFWISLEGAVVGLVIGFCATSLGGEGRAVIAEGWE